MINQPYKKIKIKLSEKTLPGTSLISLWANVKEFNKEEPILKDHMSLEIVKKINYNFTNIDKNLDLFTQISIVIRSRVFDNIIEQFIKKHPTATIINLGAGLDTTFYRVDNGKINWYDLDFPEIIETRKRLFPENERVFNIAKSLLDISWLSKIKSKKKDIFIFSTAVFKFIDKKDLKLLFSAIGSQLPGSELIFDAYNKIGLNVSRRKYRQNGMDKNLIKLSIEDSNIFKLFYEKIGIVDEFPLYARIPKKPSWSEEIINLMNLSDQNMIFKIYHLRFNP